MRTCAACLSSRRRQATSVCRPVGRRRLAGDNFLDAMQQLSDLVGAAEPAEAGSGDVAERPFLAPRKRKEIQVDTEFLEELIDRRSSSSSQETVLELQEKLRELKCRQRRRRRRPCFTGDGSGAVSETDTDVSSVEDQAKGSGDGLLGVGSGKKECLQAESTTSNPESHSLQTERTTHNLEFPTEDNRGKSRLNIREEQENIFSTGLQRQPGTSRPLPPP